MNERDTGNLQVAVEVYFKELLEEYTRQWVGDRDGKLHVQEGRQPDQDSGEVRGELRLTDSG